MKICPTCRKTYSDDSLNFCLEDGAVLTVTAPDTSSETLIMNSPRPTEAARQVYPGIQTSWDQQAQFSMQPPRKSSKAWVWVLGILGVLAVVCGGGFVAFLALLGSMPQSDSTTIASDRTNATVKSGEPTPSPSPFSSDNVQSINLAEWVKEVSIWGTTELIGEEFVMASKQKGFYYVLVAPEEYKTDLAATRVIVRNVNDAASSLGYGLIIHSDPTPLTKDLAFLIDTKRKKYRVVRHDTSKETVVVGWTTAAAIKGGVQENVLEAKDSGGRVELYINGTLVNTIRNTLSPAGGVAGLYSGDAVKVGFRGFEISK